MEVQGHDHNINVQFVNSFKTNRFNICMDKLCKYTCEDKDHLKANFIHCINATSSIDQATTDP